MLEQAVLLSGAHQALCNNILVCELENIRLADAYDGPAPPHIPVPLPKHGAILSREDLLALFSEVRDPARNLTPLSAVLFLLLSLTG